MRILNAIKDQDERGGFVLQEFCQIALIIEAWTRIRADMTILTGGTVGGWARHGDESGCNETASEGLRKCRSRFQGLPPEKKRRPRIPGAAQV